MTGRSQRLLARDKAMADLAAAGKTVAEIADVLDVNPQLVRIWTKLAGVKLVRQTKKSDERADRMALMYRQGVTLANIGNQYGLTRERVRQIIGKTGITAAEGGASKSAEYRREAAAAKREAFWLAKYGLPYAVVRQLQADRVTHAFHRHKRNSDIRGIDFRLTFIAWLSIWQASGKLDQRGRGKGQMHRLDQPDPESRCSGNCCAAMQQLLVQRDILAELRALRELLDKLSIGGNALLTTRIG